MRFLLTFVCLLFCVNVGSVYAVPLSGVHGVDASITAPHIHPVNAQNLEGAERFIERMAQDGIGLLGTSDLSDDQLQVEFRRLLKKSFDIKTIGRFALGSYWRSASKAQQKEYLSLFEDMIIRVYSKRFGDYNGEAVLVEGARPEGKYDILVFSSIVPKSGQKIKIDWRVRKKGKVYKVVDVVVEGVSMAVTQRSDFSSVIQRGGGNVDVLLEHLRK